MVGKCIAAFRKIHSIGLRELAREIGVSAATLSRIESGKPCDQNTMVLLFRWLFGDGQVKTKESPQNALQHLQAKISRISHIIELSECGYVTVDFAELKRRLGELSAVQ